eukprot:scaffold237070_cov21-Prasinocladus_malaysianus.AAC.1
MWAGPGSLGLEPTRAIWRGPTPPKPQLSWAGPELAAQKLILSAYRRSSSPAGRLHIIQILPVNRVDLT